MVLVYECFPSDRGSISVMLENYRSQSRAGFMAQSIEIMKYDGAVHLQHLNQELTTILEATPAVMPSIDQTVNFQNNFNKNQAIDEGVQISLAADTTGNRSVNTLFMEPNFENTSKFSITENALEVDRKLNANKKRNESVKISTQSQNVTRRIQAALRSPITETVLIDDQKPNADKKPKYKKKKKIISKSQSVNHLSPAAPKFPITSEAVLKDDSNADKKPKDKKTKKISSQSQSVNRLSRPARTHTTSTIQHR